MKNLKFLLMLAVVAAVGTAFAQTTPQKSNSNTYVAQYDGELFTWQLVLNPTGTCSDVDLTKACKVIAEEQPANNHIPENAEMGVYIP